MTARRFAPELGGGTTFLELDQDGHTEITGHGVPTGRLVVAPTVHGSAAWEYLAAEQPAAQLFRASFTIRLEHKAPPEIAYRISGDGEWIGLDEAAIAASIGPLLFAVMTSDIREASERN